MTYVAFNLEDIDAVRAGKVALALTLNFDSAAAMDDLLLRMKVAREVELAEALVAEINERRGRLTVVDG